MWIRKMPGEVRLEKQFQLGREAGQDILVGLTVWYGLVKAASFAGLPTGEAASGYVALGLAALILPASWLSSGRKSKRNARTVVCDHCNHLKTADRRFQCECGGRYFALPEMKWITAALTNKVPMAKSAAGAGLRWNPFEKSV